MKISARIKYRYGACAGFLLVMVVSGCVRETAAPTAPVVEKASDTSPVVNNIIDNNMRLTSPAFADAGNIPARFTCDGENINPPLAVSGVPAEAKSLVLIMDDPDAPAGDWVHWTAWNIDPDVTVIAEQSVPAGAVEGLTSFGRPGYGGPCPPSGTHHYQFKLYALDRTLDLPASAKKADIESAMAGYILTETMLVGLYQRQ
jgi:Raf kinase inhibitor-like YbhB/YbcL family protein